MLPPYATLTGFLFTVHFNVPVCPFQKYVVSQLTQERAAPDPVDGSERPHYWALPSVAHLRERLRQAKLDGVAGRRKRGMPVYYTSIV